MREVFEREHRGTVAFDEVVRRHEVRAGDRVENFVLAAQQSVCARVPAQLALHELQRRLTPVGRNRPPHLGGAAAALTIDEQVLKGSGDSTGSADPTPVEGQATTEAAGATPVDGQATTEAADADPSAGDGV